MEIFLIRNQKAALPLFEDKRASDSTDRKRRHGRIRAQSSKFEFIIVNRQSRKSPMVIPMKKEEKKVLVKLVSLESTGYVTGQDRDMDSRPINRMPASNG